MGVLGMLVRNLFGIYNCKLFSVWFATFYICTGASILIIIAGEITLVTDFLKNMAAR